MTNQAFERLIDAIYEAPLRTDGWSSLAPALQEHLGAPVALFLAHAEAVNLLGEAGPVSGADMYDYADHLWREDRAMSVLRSAPPGEIISDTQLISDRERLGSRFYNDLLGSNGLERGLYASIAGGADGLMFIAAQRSARAGDYDLAEIGAMREIVPHLRRSYRTWLRLRQVEVERQAACKVMEHMSLGFVLVDGDGKLRSASRIAEEEMRHGALLVSDGRVTCRSPQARKGFQGAVQAAARQRRAVAEQITLERADGSLSSILVAPVRDEAMAAAHTGGLAMISIRGRECKELDAAALGRSFDLTPAEARLLAALASGERLPAYARRQGIAVTTAKTHLKALFEKVGERRQADLIRRAVSDPFLRAAEASPD